MHFSYAQRLRKFMAWCRKRVPRSVEIAKTPNIVQSPMSNTPDGFLTPNASLGLLSPLSSTELSAEPLSPRTMAFFKRLHQLAPDNDVQKVKPCSPLSRLWLYVYLINTFKYVGLQIRRCNPTQLSLLGFELMHVVAILKVSARRPFPELLVVLPLPGNALWTFIGVSCSLQQYRLWQMVASLPNFLQKYFQSSPMKTILELRSHSNMPQAVTPTFSTHYLWNRSLESIPGCPVTFSKIVSLLTRVGRSLRPRLWLRGRTELMLRMTSTLT